MKKLLKFLAFLTATALAESAFAVAGWVGGGAVYVHEKDEGVCNGWYYTDVHSSTSWCSGPFDGEDLGELTTLTLGGQVQLWDEGNADWRAGSTAQMHYAIDDGAFQTVTLDYYKFQDNNNFFQSGGDSFAQTDVDFSGLSAGTHTLSVKFEDVDGLKPTAVYTATFTFVPPVAKIGDDAFYASFAEALGAAEAGDTITLLTDIDATAASLYNGTRIPIGKSLSIDGQGHVITVAKRGFGPGLTASSPVDVTFKDVVITNGVSEGRCIDTRGSLNSLTLDGVTLTTAGSSYTGYIQTLTIGGNQATPATVTIKDSTIETSEDATKYYAIVTFNPVDMTITNSTIKGWACLYLKGQDGSAGSAGSVIDIDGCTLVSKNIYAGESNDFGLIKIEDDDIEINIVNTEILIDGESNTQAIASFETGALEGIAINLGEGNEVTLENEGTFVVNGSETAQLLVSGGSFNMEVPEDVCAEGFIPAGQDPETGLYSVKEGVYVARNLTTGQGYETFAEALSEADDGATIALLADIDATDAGLYSSQRIPIGKSLVIDGQDYTIAVAQRGFGVGVGASSPIDVTFQNVTIVNSSASGRCVDTRGNLNSLTLDNAKLLAPASATQPLTIGGNQATAATVAIRNGSVAQTMEDGSYGYAITTFNPVNMTIEDSTVKGWACLNIKAASSSAGSAGSVINIDGCTLVSKNVYAGESNAFSAIKVEDDDVEINITNTEILLDGESNTQCIASFQKLDLETSSANSTVSLGEGNNVTFEGDCLFEANAGETSGVSVSGGFFNAEVPEDVCADGFIPVAEPDPVTGLYTVQEGATITFENYDGTELETQNVAKDGAVAYGGENPVRANDGEGIYTWTGWTDGTTVYGKTASLPVAGTNDVTYTATFSSVAPVAKIGDDNFYPSLAAAVDAANDNDVITLLADDTVSLTSGGEIEIDKPLTITGPVDEDDGYPLYTIYGTPTNTGCNDVFVASASGTVKISNVAFAEFGNEAANSVNGHAPVFVSSGNNSVVLENLVISDFNRTGIKINGGEFLVTNCLIDCSTEMENYRIGGIDVANDATGAIVGTTITDVVTSDPSRWVSAGLELIGSGAIRVEDCTISSAINGIFVSTAAGTSPGSSAVTVINTTVEADMYSLANDSDAGAVISVQSGDFTGPLDSTEETGLSISGGTFDEPVPAEYCAEGMVPTGANAQGRYSVEDDPYTASFDPEATTYSIVGSSAAAMPATIVRKDGATLAAADKAGWALVYDPDTLRDGTHSWTLKTGLVTFRAYRNDGASLDSYTATVSLTRYGKVYDTCEVAVSPGATITTDNANKLVEDGAETVTALKINGTAVEDIADYVITSDDPTAATVEQSGSTVTITPLKAGKATFTVALAGDAMKTVSASLTFAAAAAKIGDTYYKTVSAAFTAATSGQTVELCRDVTESVSFSGNQPRVDGFVLNFDLKGHTLTGAANQSYALRVSYGIVTVKDTVGGGGVAYGKDFAFIVDHLAGNYISKLVLESGAFSGKTCVAQAGLSGGSGSNKKYYGGEIEVLGGTFEAVMDTGDTYDENGNMQFVLNKLAYSAAAYPGGEYSPSVITVKGGSFYKFDPANNVAEGAGTSFLPEEGYLSYADDPEEDWYTVYEAVAVTFVTDHGTAPDGQVIGKGKTASEPTPAPTDACWSFNYWTLDGAEYDFDTPVTEDIELVADWTRKTVTLTVPAVANATVSATTNGVALAGTAGENGATLYEIEAGTAVTVTYTAADGYHVTGKESTTATYEISEGTMANDYTLDSSATTMTIYQYTVTFTDHSGEISSELYDYGATPDVPETAPVSYTEGTTIYTGVWPEVSSVITNVTYEAVYSGAAAKAMVSYTDGGETVTRGVYATLAEAISAAQADDTVTMLADEALAATVAVSKEITLNLNSRTISKGSIANNTALVSVAAAGDLTITGSGAITNSSVYGINVSGKLTLKGGLVHARQAAIAMTSGNGIVVVDGADVIVRANNMAVYQTAGGASFTLKNGTIASLSYSTNPALGINAGMGAIEGGTVTAEGTGVLVNGTLTVSGGTLESTGSSAGSMALSIGGTGTASFSGGTVTATGGTAIKNTSGSLVITDGSFYGARNAVSFNGSGYTGEISGGSFKPATDFDSLALELNKYIVYGYELDTTADANGYYPVVPAAVMAKIGDEPYYTLAAAIEAAENGDEIVLQRDVANGAGIMVDSTAAAKGLTINFDGHSYEVFAPGVGSSGTENQALHFDAGSLTLKNGTINVAENPSDRNILMFMQNYTDLTLENMTLDARNMGTTYSLVNFNSGASTMTDTVILLPEGATEGVSVNFGSDNYPNGASFAVDGESVIDGPFTFGLQGGATNVGSNAGLTIAGGTFTGIEFPEVSAATAEAIEISGGTFNVSVPEEYLALGYQVVLVEGSDPEMYAVTALTPIQYYNTWSVPNVFYFDDEDPIPARTTQGTVPTIKRTGETSYHAVEEWVEISWTVTATNATDASTPDDSIATVDADGLVTFSQPGTVKVWLTMTDPSGASKSGSKTVKYDLAPAYVVSADGQTKTAYGSLYSAFTAAQDGETVVLGKDGTGNNLSKMTLDEEKAVTLDLNGHTFTFSQNYRTNAFGAFITVQKGSLTVVDSGETKGGIVVSGTNARAFNMDCEGNTSATDAVLTIGEGVNVSSASDCCVTVFGPCTLNTEGNLTSPNDFAIAGNGMASCAGTVINVTGGTVTGGEVGIYHPQDGVLNISGGTITGATAVYVKAGELNVSGGTLVGTGAAAGYTYNGNGANATGDALVIDNCGYPGGVPAASITGGTFISENAQSVASYVATDDAAYTGGGSFEKVDGFIAATVDGGANPALFSDAEADGVPEGYMLALVEGSDPEMYQVVAAFTIVWDVDGVQTTNVVAVGTVTATIQPADPTREATASAVYSFAGWTPAPAETVTEDKTYTATWDTLAVDPAELELYPNCADYVYVVGAPTGSTYAFKFAGAAASGGFSRTEGWGKPYGNAPGTGTVTAYVTNDNAEVAVLVASVTVKDVCAVVDGTEYAYAEWADAVAAAIANESVLEVYKGVANVTLAGGETLRWKSADNRGKGSVTCVAPAATAEAMYKVTSTKDEETGITTVVCTNEGTPYVMLTKANGDVSYADKFTSFANGNTYKVLRDFDSSRTAISYTNVTIDLNGHTVTYNESGNYPAILLGTTARKGTLLITDTSEEGTGKIANLGSMYVVWAAYKASSVTIEKGAIEASGGYAVYTSGGSTAVISGGMFQDTTSAEPGFLLNCKDDNTGTITVTGGSFKGFDPADNGADGEGTCYIPATHISVADDPEDGWFTVYEAVTVTFVDDKAAAPEAQRIAKGSTAEEPDVPTAEGFVFGGWFAEGETEAFDFSTAVEADLTLTAAWNDAVAKDNLDNYYDSLAAAVAGAPDGGTVTLLADIGLSATVAIDKDLTIDLSSNDIAATGCRALWIKAGTVGITGEGTVSANGEGLDETGSVIRVGDAVANEAAAKLTVGEDVTVSTSKSYGITTFGKNAGGIELDVYGTVAVTSGGKADAAISGNGNGGLSAVAITIHEGAVVSATNGAGIFFPGAGTLVIEGGDVTGPTAVYAKSGSVTVSGGTLRGTGAAAAYQYKGDGLVATGDALVIDTCGYPNGNPAATVTGGTLVSANGKAVASYAKDESYTALGDIIPPTSEALFGDAESDGVPEGYALVESETAGLYRIEKLWTVTFVDEDGTELSTADYPYGTAATAIVQPDEPTKEADAQFTFAFAGWDPEVAEVTTNATYKATYSFTTNEYTVAFVDEDGTELSTAEYPYGTEATDIVQPDEPTKEADAQFTYAFAGWDPEVADVTTNATYKATYSFTTNAYEVAFEWHGDSFATNYPYGTAAADVAVPDDPENYTENGTNYAFTGWSPAAVADVTTNATYTAQYGIVPEVDVSCVVTANGDDDEMTLVLAGPDDCDGVADVAIYEWDDTGAEPVPGEVVWSTNGVALAEGAAELTVSIDTGVVLPGQLVVAAYLPNDKYSGATASNRVMGTSSIILTTESSYQVDDNIVLGLEAYNSTGDIAVTLWVSDGNGGLTEFDWECAVVENTVEVGELPAGEYVVTAVLAGDANYLGSTDTKSFRVDKLEPGLEAEAGETTEGEPVVVTATLGYDDCTGTVTVAVDGSEYVGDVVDGVAAVIISDLAAGDYEATVTYSGDDQYLEASTNCAFTVAVARPFEEVDGVIWYYEPVGSNAMVTGIAEAHATGNLTMPDTLGGLTVTSVGIAAFHGMTNITGMVLAAGVKDIWRDAFMSCTGLTNVTMGAAVETIDRDAFSDCPGLTDVTIPNGVKVISTNAFNLSGLTNVTFGTGLTSIEQGAFGTCTNLTDVKIPDGVTSIGKLAFYDNRSLTNAWLGTGIESVGEDAFYGCEHLETIWIPVEQRGTELLTDAGVREGCEIHYYGTQVVKFDANGGTCDVKTNGYTIGEAYGWLPEAEREGYDFTGWWDEAEGVQLATNDTVTEYASRTLAAHWSKLPQPNLLFRKAGTWPAAAYLSTAKDSVTATTNGVAGVTLYLNYAYANDGGTAAAAHKVKAVVKNSSGTVVTNLAWSRAALAVGGTRKTANLAFTLKKAGAYTLEVTLDSTGTVAESNENDNKTRIKFKVAPSQTVTFNPNGGTCATKKRVYVQAKKYGTMPTATRTGYALAGWFTAKSGGKKVTTTNTVSSASSLTVYAHWVLAQTTKFDANGGTCSPAWKTYPVGKKYGSLPTPTWAGHAFTGWYTAKGGTNVTASSVVIAKTTWTLRARWTTNQVVTFNANGGTCATKKKTYTIGKKYGTMPTATRAGYALAGWYTAKTGGTKVTTTSVAAAKKSLTLYARWTSKQTTKFDANGGTCATDRKTYPVGQKYGSLPTPTRSGQSFTGWYTAKEGGTKVTADSLAPAKTPVTLYAHWKAAARTRAAISGISMSEPEAGEEDGAQRRGMARRGGGGNLVLTVETEAGAEYELQWTPELGGEWETVLRWVAEESESEVELPLAKEERMGFFRLVLREDAP